MKKVKTGAVMARGDRVFNWVNGILLGLITLVALYPVYFVLIASISDPHAIMNGEVVFLPKGSNLAGFQRVLRDNRLLTGYLNSIIYTVCTIFISSILTLMSGYVLSRKDFALQKPLLFLVSFTMFFSGGMIPSFLVIRNLGMLDSMWSLILPGAISTWNLLITKTFLQTTIPDELRESASIDGCGNFRFFCSIVLPLSTVIIVILALWYGVGQWNAYGSALLYIYNTKKYPLQLVLRDILLRSQIAASTLAAEGDGNLTAAMYEIAQSVKYAVVVAACLPIIIVFPFIEKHFVKGVMIGSIKG